MVTSGDLASIEVAAVETATAPTGQLANTGGALALGLLGAGAFALVTGGLLVAIRRRRIGA